MTALLLAETAADSLHIAADTAQAGATGAEIFSHLLEHVKDAREIETPLGHFELPAIELFGVDMSVTKHVVFLWVASLILIIGLAVVARKNTRRRVPTGFGNLVEIFIVFLRDEIVLPNMGAGGLKYLPYLLTTFFFILTMNLMGVVPYGASSTGNVSVTAGLAVIAYIMIQASAIRAQGFGHYLAHFTGGVHWALWPIMIPIEILGTFTKAFALCIRLFANMTGGHIVILSFIGLIFLFRSYLVAPVSLAFALGVNLLELFVAFLQAYIFTMLTSLFMGLGIRAGHSEHK